jgi:small subunit ribosomal protein S6
MPSYDLVYIVRPDLEADAINAVIERATQRLVDQGATVEHSEPWGKRRMAYPLQRYREGHYVFTRFTASGTTIPEIRHGLRIMEDVLRASITVSVGPIQPKAAQPAPTEAGSAPPAGAPAPVAPAPVVSAPAVSAPTPSDATAVPAESPQE